MGHLALIYPGVRTLGDGALLPEKSHFPRSEEGAEKLRNMKWMQPDAQKQEMK